MNFIEERIHCPYCSQPLEILVEPYDGEQTYVEDCQVCCSPMLITASVGDGQLIALSVLRENE